MTPSTARVGDGRHVAPTRVMVFYDGDYFRKGQVYFRYKERRGWMNLVVMHRLIEAYVASQSGTPPDLTRVVAAQHYDGRAPSKLVGPERLDKERDFELALIRAGITPYYLELTEAPVQASETEDQGCQLIQKGLDVQIAIDVLDYAHQNRFDVAVLIAGDADFVPLVRRITSLGKQTLVAYFTFEGWTDARGAFHNPSYAARSLLEAASWSLNFNQLVVDSAWQDAVADLFLAPRES
ncbi:MAG: NYN domain-containing protein [Actinobacteria bacterium]|nr:NYN domain-containing protein [Actinomycetota bacterium]